jgi:hypothetical protein
MEINLENFVTDEMKNEGEYKIIDLSEFLDLQSLEALALEGIDSFKKHPILWRRIADKPGNFETGRRFNLIFD